MLYLLRRCAAVRLLAVNIELTERGLKALLAKLTRVEKAFQSPGALKRSLGRMLVAQTRRRLLEEKTSPDGIQWAPWDPGYAATRGAQHSLLMDSHAMLNSIRASVTKDGASVHSDVAYAARQNAARPFLGLSAENKAEMVEFVNEWMAKI